MSVRAHPFTLVVEGREYGGHWSAQSGLVRVMSLFGSRAARTRGYEGAEMELANELLRGLVLAGLG
jgi:hypothetical protein